MKKITPKDIENPKRQSGYDFVGPNGSTPSARSLGKVKWEARVSLSGAEQKATGKRFLWRGVGRKTPLEAAQDYCDYVNGNQVSAPKKLKSAGHTAPKRNPRTPRNESAAAKRLRKLKRECRELEAVVRAESKGSKGHVYCIGEEPDLTANLNVEVCNGVVFRGDAVKVGYAAKSPQQRLRELQTGNPRKLVLIGSIRGTLADEAKLHQEFIHQNVLQEWFRPTPALLSRFTNKEV